MPYSPQDEEFLFLLGAGCSRDVDIPMSAQMVDDVEKSIISDNKWKPFKELYYYLKSCILYSDGIHGEFDRGFNIERLLVVISEIEKKERSLIYPFIGSWDNRLIELAGKGFENLKSFKDEIKRTLGSKWIKIKDKRKANYYKGFADFQRECGCSMRVFNLNYDLCFEKIVKEDNGLEVQDGFDENMTWDYDNFNLPIKPNFYHYKLHGSINWHFESEVLKKEDDYRDVAEVIFGIETKLQSNDPYLYYTSQFRQYLLHPNLKTFIVIGYSFSDEYINKIIKQSLIRQENMKLLVVTFVKLNGDPTVDLKIIRDKKENILKDIFQNTINHTDFVNKIEIYNKGAKEFLQELSIDFLISNGYLVDNSIF